MCPSENGSLYCSESNYLKVDDTIQITGSKYNNGLYTIVSIKNNVITLDKPLVNGIFNAICKVEYPFDIVDGAVKLLDWELNQKRKDKQGITSESISRHSVSYKQYDESNMTEGYPSELMAFVKKYVEWRT